MPLVVVEVAVEIVVVVVVFCSSPFLYHLLASSSIIPLTSLGDVDRWRRPLLSMASASAMIYRTNQKGFPSIANESSSEEEASGFMIEILVMVMLAMWYGMTTPSLFA